MMGARMGGGGPAAIDYAGGLGAAAAAARQIPRVQARPPGWLAPPDDGRQQQAGLGSLMQMAMRQSERPRAEAMGAEGAAKDPAPGASAYQAPGVVQQEPLPPLPPEVPVAVYLPGGMGLARGGLAAAPRRARRRASTGLVHSATPGRADLVGTRLRRGSYVLPADVVSGLGEGNTMAGAKLLRASLPEAAEMAARGAINRAMGGLAAADDEMEVRLSGGEFLISPEQVLAIGEGDLGAGAAALDDLVHAVRASTREALGRMPPPK